MSESFEQLLNEQETKVIKNGEVVTGTVLAVKDDEIQLNLDYKHDGIIKKDDFAMEDPTKSLTEVVKVGDTVEAKILKINDGEGMVLLSTRKLRASRVSEVLQKAFDEKEILKAPVTEVVKGGIIVIVDETRIFIPSSLTGESGDLTALVGQEIEFRLDEFAPKNHKIIGNRRDIIREQRKALRAEAFAKLEVGQVIEGTVETLTAYGAFINLGGVDGLLHCTEMTWGRMQRPDKLFKVGDKVKVLIRDINEEKKLISLTAKFPEDNPWAGIEDEFPVGAVVKGKVARLTDFGAFVELREGVDGLIHVSQIQYGRVEKPGDVLKVGQEVEAKVTDLDLEKNRISLSMKELLPKPERKERPAKKAESNADEEKLDIEAFVKEQAEKAETEAEAEAENTEM